MKKAPSSQLLKTYVHCFRIWLVLYTHICILIDCSYIDGKWKKNKRRYEFCVNRFTSSDANSYVRKISKIYLELLVLYSTINCFDSLFFCDLILIILMFIVFTEARMAICWILHTLRLT